MLRYPTYFILLFVLLVGLSFSSLHAVNAFKAGYYLRHSGDSIRGYVKFGSRFANETQCVFKPDKQSKSQKFLPSDIAAYGIDGGKSFLSRTISKDTVSVDPVDKRVFVEILQEGRLRLLRYQQRFFFEYEAGTKFEELISSTVIKNIGYRVYQEAKHEYIDVLIDAMGDCPSVSIPIKNGHRKLELTERDLMKLMEDYHACLKEPLVQPDSRPGLRLSFGSVIGGGETTISYRPGPSYTTLEPGTNSVIYSLVNTKYAVARSAMFGFSINLAFPRGYSDVALQAEILYKPLRFLGEKEFSVAESNFNDPHDISDELEIRLHKIMIPIGLRKTFGKGPRPFYLVGGLSLHMNVGRAYIVSRDALFTKTGTPILNIERPWASNSFEPGIWAHAGMVLISSIDSQLAIELRAEQSGTKNGLNDWRSGAGENRYLLRSVSLSLAYGFWSKDSANK